jgi:speckle-type POZ protein
MATDLFTLAERYEVQPLKEICIQHMAENISVDNAIDVLTSAVRYSVAQAKSSALDFIRQNLLDVALTDAWATFIQDYPQYAQKLRSAILNNDHN